MTVKRRNAADVTMRNIRATRAACAARSGELHERIARLERVVAELEKAVSPNGPLFGDCK